MAPSLTPNRRAALVLATALTTALAALLVALVALGPNPVANARPAHAQTQSSSCDPLTVPLAPGFNLVGVLDATPPGLLAPGAAAVFGWNAAAQQYNSWRPGLPPALNTLATVDAHAAVWISVDDGGPASITIPTTPQTARAAPMSDGWNVTTWTGPNATPVADAFSPQAFGAQLIVQSPFVSAMTYDNMTQRFNTFDTRLPEALSTLTQLNFGDAVWISLVAGLDWLIPGSTPCDDPTDEGSPDDGNPTTNASPLDGFLFDTTPVDLVLVTAIGAPGQLRGNDYKGHGLFRTDSNDTIVVSPIAAVLYDGSAYIADGTVQYLLSFRISPDLVFILDHVLDPSQKVLDAFVGQPPPLVDDSRTRPLIEQTFAAGDVIATAIGFRDTNNAFVDFGFYDLSRPNDASQQPGFEGDPSTSRDANAVCWYGRFGPDAEQIILPLVGLFSAEGATSDICPVP